MAKENKETAKRANEIRVMSCGLMMRLFGASYPDAVCIDGYMWDADSGESDAEGITYSVGGDIPCPVCNTEKWIDLALENDSFDIREEALVYVERLKNKHKDEINPEYL